MMSYQILPEVRREAEKRILEALESDNPDEFLPAANAHLRHRLRNSFQRIDEKREIDLQYLNCAEYQLFLDDMRAGGACHQPDHWTTSHFPKGSSLQPILGVRPEDAEAYCQWLTRKHGGAGIRYRMPRRSEARDLPVSQEMISCWCRDSGQFHLIGLVRDDESRLRNRFMELFAEELPSVALMDVNRNRESDLSPTRDNLGRRFFFATCIALLIVPLLLASLAYSEITTLIFFAVIGYIIGAVIVGVILYVIGVSCLWLLFTMVDAADSKRISLPGCNLILMSLGGLGLLIAISAGAPLLLLSLALPSLILFAIWIFPPLGRTFYYFAARIRGGLYWIQNSVRSLVFRKRNRREAARKTAEASIDARNLTPERLEQQKTALSEIVAVSRASKTPGRPNADRHQGFLTDVYWWWQTVIARQENKLPAWEGIRIVREFRD